MQIEDYFEFRSANDIRVKGTRVGIEVILFDYLDHGLVAEQIANLYPSLTVEQVQATLTYYQRNRDTLDAYLQQLTEEDEQIRQQQSLHPTPAVRRLRNLANQQQNSCQLDPVA